MISNAPYLIDMVMIQSDPMAVGLFVCSSFEDTLAISYN